MNKQVAFFDSHSFEEDIFNHLNKEKSQGQYHISYFPIRLNPDSAILARGHQVACSFANDKVNALTLNILKESGVKLVCIRGAGTNHVDLVHAQKIGIPVVRVPAYSPHAIAEHAVCLVLSLNRKIVKSVMRVRELNFSLDNLVGFDLYRKTVGVIGMGRIGKVFAKIMQGFGCQVLAFDKYPEACQDSGVEMVPLKELFQRSDIISLHVPLTPETFHIINDQNLEQMKRGVMLINTGRGALVDTKALIAALKSGQVGHAGLDVYEEEENVFFKDLSNQILLDDQLARLMTFPNVMITSHQGFLTKEALTNIAESTLNNIDNLFSNRPLQDLI